MIRVTNKDFKSLKKSLDDQTKDIERRKREALGKVVNLTFQQAATKQILDGQYRNAMGYTQPPGADLMGTIYYKNQTTGKRQKRKVPLFVSNKIVSRTGETYRLYSAMSNEDLSADTEYSPFEIRHTPNRLTVNMDGGKLSKKIWSLERGGYKPRNSLRKSLNSVWRRFAKLFKDAK